MKKVKLPFCTKQGGSFGLSLSDTHERLHELLKTQKTIAARDARLLVVVLDGIGLYSFIINKEGTGSLTWMRCSTGVG